MAKSGKSFDNLVRSAVAAKIRAKRAEAGLSQEQLGARARIHRTYIGAIERCEKNVTAVTLAKIARALHCKLADLVPEDLSF